MKAVDFPAATPVAASSCESFTAPLNNESETSAFAQVMEQAMGGASQDASDAADSESDTDLDASTADAKAVEADSATASHWLAALIVPLVTPVVTKAPASAPAAETNVMALGGEAAVDCSALEDTAAAPEGTPAPGTSNELSSPATALAKTSAAETPPATEPTVARSIETLKPFGGVDLKLSSTTAINAATAPANPAAPAANAVAAAMQNPATRADEPAVEVALTTEVAGQKLPEGVSVETAPRLNRSARHGTVAKGEPFGSIAAAETHGTSGAKYVSPPKAAENMNEFTGSSQQNLPGTATLDAPVSPAKSFRAASTGSALKAEAVGAASLDFSAPAHRAEAVTAPAPVAPISTRSLDRAEDLMALHGLRLRDSGLDSMRVVIKPDPNLHLALNVQMRDSVVEITAQLQRGDHEAMSRHWPELQAQLEQRGIRLAPLAQSESNNQSSSNSNSFSQHSSRQQQSEERQTRSGAFAEFALESVLVPKRAAKATIPRGWESWA